MDLNKLYFDHQMLVMKAREPAVQSDRCAHEAAAHTLAARIGAFQRQLGAANAATWEALAAAPCECTA